MKPDFIGIGKLDEKPTQVRTSLLLLKAEEPKKKRRRTLHGGFGAVVTVSDLMPRSPQAGQNRLLKSTQ